MWLGAAKRGHVLGLALRGEERQVHFDQLNANGFRLGFGSSLPYTLRAPLESPPEIDGLFSGAPNLTHF